MNLWLDDIRNPNMWGSDGMNWVWAMDYEETIAVLSTGLVEFASLDHDLGEDQKSGYDVVCWMEEHNLWPSNGVFVHSWNPVGAERMRKVIARAYGKQ